MQPKDIPPTVKETIEKTCKVSVSASTIHEGSRCPPSDITSVALPSKNKMVSPV